MEVLKVSVSTTILIIAILIVRLALRNKITPKLFMFFWGVAVIRLFVPFYIFEPTLTNQTLKPASQALYSSVFSSDTVSPSGSPDLGSVFLAIWLVGVFSFMLLFVFRHVRLVKLLGTSLPSSSSVVAEWLELNCKENHIKVRVSDRVGTPIVIGFFRSSIILPTEIDTVDSDSLRQILCHEHVHIKRKDMIFKAFALLGVCFHWFNPFVWIMFLCINRDIELVCDECVVNRLDKFQRAHYAKTLVELAYQGNNSISILSGFGEVSIKERVIAIMKIKANYKVGLWVSVALFSFVTLAGFTMPKNQEQVYETYEGMKLFGSQIEAFDYYADLAGIPEEKFVCGEDGMGIAGRGISNDGEIYFEDFAFKSGNVIYEYHPGSIGLTQQSQQ